MSKRVLREKKTLEIMAMLYCKRVHKTPKPMCDRCREVYEYSVLRISSCPRKSYRGVCKGCTIHCFKDEYREEIKKIMRYSGPRLLFKHPLLAIAHVLDGLKKTKGEKK